jgi:uncharacterized transporter YbjL
MNLQLKELLIAYLLSGAGTAAGLLLMRADRRAWWRLPLYSAMAMALGVILWNLLRKQVFPLEWGQTHGSLMYYAVLALYVLLGLAMGLFLGRLTRRR